MSRFRTIPYIKFIPVFVIGLIVYKLINNVDDVFNWFKYLFSIMSYLIWGLVIAYFLNYSIEFMIKYLRFKRLVSIIVIYVIFISLIGFLVYAIIPVIQENSAFVADKVPEFIDSLTDYLNSMKNNNLVDNLHIIELLENKRDDIVSSVQDYINVVLFKVADVTTMIIKFVLGVIISFYVLKDKEKIQKYIKRLMYAVLKKDTAEKIIYIVMELHILFSKFILGRLIVSLIVGILCFIILSIIKAPLTPMISIIIGVTNIFPYIGPLVGAVVSTAIILFFDPIKAIWCLIAFILIQTLDGFFMGPKIVGDQVDVSPLMIITALVVGGGFLGIVGMLIAVPIIALSDRFLKIYVKERLKEKNLDV